MSPYHHRGGISVEIFKHPDAGYDPAAWNEDGSPAAPGWYWWSCHPGCLPDGPPYGPHRTAAAALRDALPLDLPAERRRP